MYNLGLMYELGQGMKADPVEATMWYVLAAGDVPNAGAHRDALWRNMTPQAQARVSQLAASCRQSGYKNCH
jgi:hypothetical protein